MKFNAWISAMFISVAVCALLFFGITNNSESVDPTPIDLYSVTNEQLEEVVRKNPDVFGRRRYLANRY